MKTYLPAPSPETVRAARAYLTPRHAIGADQILWDLTEHPLPDPDAIDAVLADSDRAQQSPGDQAQADGDSRRTSGPGGGPLDMDQTEARLLDAAQASATRFVEIWLAWLRAWCRSATWWRIGAMDEVVHPGFGDLGLPQATASGDLHQVPVLQYASQGRQVHLYLRRCAARKWGYVA
ncbi:hypothetical protein GCM10027176_13500 [Actinoallomurus bryophytorum]|uniref:hypothetical protein n=1 Tax=Actinoallomurus bryophytorum TaxID=1490222 RepID=UPI0011536FC3|nr:hypothetical protein [Actinoallomurus bryophytorum]